MNHIFYQTKTKYTNTGDALINNALINALREYGVLHANYSSNIPVSFLNALGIRPEERVLSENELAFIKSVIDCAIKCRKTGDRVFIFSGPGDMYGGGLRLVMRNLASGLVFPVFRLFGVEIVRIGRSVGPVSKLMALSELIRSIFLSHYYVRDTQSLERCKRMGIQNVKMCPDMSWIYHLGHPQKINYTNTVMVNFRNSIFDDVDEGFVEATLQKCDEILAQLKKNMNGQMKVCVAFQIAEDEEFSKIIYNRLCGKYDVEYIDHQLQLNELEQYYGKVAFHISNRMHSLLAGYKYGSLPIALIDTQNHVKISATFSDCNLDELMFDIHEPINDKRLCEILNQRPELIQKLFDCEQDKCNEIKETLDFIFSTNAKAFTSC